MYSVRSLGLCIFLLATTRYAREKGTFPSSAKRSCCCFSSLVQLRVHFPEAKLQLQKFANFNFLSSFLYPSIYLSHGGSTTKINAKAEDCEQIKENFFTSMLTLVCAYFVWIWMCMHAWEIWEQQNVDSFSNVLRTLLFMLLWLHLWLETYWNFYEI